MGFRSTAKTNSCSLCESPCFARAVLGPPLWCRFTKTASISSPMGHFRAAHAKRSFCLPPGESDVQLHHLPPSLYYSWQDIVIPIVMASLTIQSWCNLFRVKATLLRTDSAGDLSCYFPLLDTSSRLCPPPTTIGLVSKNRLIVTTVTDH